MSQTERVVYVVDDETVIAESLAKILVQAGFKAIAFDNPLLALEAVKTEPPQLLISDVVMPQITGVELAIRIRRLLFSGKSATADLLEHARHQGYEFELLTKPVHPSDLLARLQSHR
jgi:DNA-binding response OmpR family regulator